MAPTSNFFWGTVPPVPRKSPPVLIRVRGMRLGLLYMTQSHFDSAGGGSYFDMKILGPCNPEAERPKEAITITGDHFAGLRGTVRLKGVPPRGGGEPVVLLDCETKVFGLGLLPVSVRGPEDDGRLSTARCRHHPTHISPARDGLCGGDRQRGGCRREALGRRPREVNGTGGGGG